MIIKPISLKLTTRGNKLLHNQRVSKQKLICKLLIDNYRKSIHEYRTKFQRCSDHWSNKRQFFTITLESIFDPVSIFQNQLSIDWWASSRLIKVQIAYEKCWSIFNWKKWMLAITNRYRFINRLINSWSMFKLLDW